MTLLKRSLHWTLPTTPKERVVALWAAGYFFMLLAGYYVLRPLRDQMGIAGGVKTLPWMFMATFLTLLVMQPLFGALVLESLQQYLTQTFSSSATYLIAYGVLFLVVILIMPRGVVPGVSALLERRRVKAAVNASAERDAKVPGGVAGAAQ